MSNLFFRNARLTALSIGLVLVAGFSAVQVLPRQEDPALARRFGTVTTFFPGASALRVESLVTEKIEAELQELHEIDEIDSLSRTGVSVIQIDLADRFEEEDVDEVWSKVRDRIADAEARLPPGALPPEFEDRTSTAVTFLAGLVWEQAGPPELTLMSRLAEELEDRLRNIPGTKEAERFGEAEEEIRVTVDPDLIASMNLTAADISRAVVRADAKLPAGQLRHGANDLLIEVEGELSSLERVRRIPVREEADGRLLRLGDVATVEKTVREPARTVAMLGGQRGVAVAATMEPARRVDLWAKQARAVAEAFRAEVPTGIGFHVVFDQSRYTEERLSNLVGNLLLGATLVILVLLGTMGLRSALIVSATLPLTIAMVLGEMLLIGLPLHQTSITGLIVALGLLIDNAIVVVDDYDKRVRKGASRGDAVAGAVRHLFVPLFASTLTTVLAFLPIALMPGGAGEFVGPIAIGVGLAVSSSFLLAMSVVPALAAFATRQLQSRGKTAWWRDGFTHPALTRIYRRSLELVLRRPAVGIAFSMLLPLVGFVVVSTLPMQFFPANDRDQFQVQVVLPSQSSIEETIAAGERARALIHRHDEVVESHWFFGETAPRVFYNMFSNQDGVSSYAGAFVTTRSADATEVLLPELQRELIAAFPTARAIALPFEQGPPFEAPIELRILGPDLAELRRLGEEARAVLARSLAVTYTTAKLEGGEPKLLVAADEAQARMAGLRLGDIADQLNGSLEGVVGGSILEATEEIPVRVRIGADDRADLASIASKRVLAPGRSGQGARDDVPGVPLSALSEIELVPEIAGITRRNGERSNTVQAFLDPYALIATSTADFRRRLEASGFELPAGYRIELGGESEQRGEAMGKLAAFALPLFVIMAGAVILSFNSFRMAGIIGAVAFLSVGLAFFGVWLFGYPMGFVAIVGTMGLVGLAINGGIVVLSALRASERAKTADVPETADVVVGATRHIVATTLTTIVGFLPLILDGGRFWPPMATAIAGGVGGSAILALYMVPSLFMLAVRRDLRRAAKEEVAPAPAQGVAVAAR